MAELWWTRWPPASRVELAPSSSGVPRQRRLTPAANDRQMAIAAVLHHPQRLDRERFRRHRVGIFSHDFGKQRCGRVEPGGDHAIHDVALREDTFELALGRDQDRAALSPLHCASGIEYRG